MLHFDHAEIEESMVHVCEDRYLRCALLAAMDNDRITQLSGETVVAQDVGSVTLASGQTLKAKLIIGADGRTWHRHPRWHQTHRLGYGQTAIVCAVGHENPTEESRTSSLCLRPACSLPLLQRCSIVWSETDARAAKSRQWMMPISSTHFAPHSGISG
jgi:2-octaprenyl-6-methoxyphenol hydroxylase